MTDNLTDTATIVIENILSNMTLKDILSYRQTNRSAKDQVNNYLRRLFRRSHFEYYKWMDYKYIVERLRLLETMYPPDMYGNVVGLEEVVDYFNRLFPREVIFLPMTRSVMSEDDFCYYYLR